LTLVTLLSGARLQALEGVPEIHQLLPRGAQRGELVTVSVEGADLTPEAELITSLSSRLKLVTQDPDLAPRPERLTYRGRLNATEAPGRHLIRLRTTKGLSNAVTFIVDTLPQVPDTEPNDAFAAAQEIPTPIIVDGQLGEGDRDTFRLTVQAGQRLVFDAEAHRIDSTVDPTLRLLNSAGQEIRLSENERGLDVDARIDHFFETTGEYFLQIHEATFVKPKLAYYRLRIGNFHYADAVFPLGGRAGSLVEVAVQGGNLAAKARARVSLPPSPFAHETHIALPAEIGGGAALFPFRVGQLPEVIEADREPRGTHLVLEPDVTVNGRILAPQEHDTYELTVAPGESWSIEVEAAALGSWLDGVLKVRDADGNELATADDIGGLDPRAEVKVPEGTTLFKLDLYDLHGRGGPAYAYRLTARRKTPTFTLRLARPKVELPAEGTGFLQIQCGRQGYDGPIDLSLAAPPQGFRLRGGIIPAGESQGFLTFTGPGDAKLRYLELEVFGVGGSPEEPFLQQARARIPLGRGAGSASDAGLKLPCAITEPQRVKLWLDRESLRLPIGHSVTLKAEIPGIEKIHGRMFIDGLPGPQGVEIERRKINGESSQETVKISARPDAKPARGFAVILCVYEESDDATVRIPAPALEVELVHPFSLTAGSPVEGAAAKLTALPGERITVEGSISREAPFEGPVDVKLMGLPEGTPELTTQIGAESTTFRLEVEVPRSLQPGALELSLVASTQLGEEKAPVVHTIPAVPVQLEVRPRQRRF